MCSSDLGLDGVDVVEADDPLWARQRAGQRSARRALVRVHVPPSRLGDVFRATDLADGTLVGRAAFGTAWVELDPDAVGPLRAALPQGSLPVLLDLPPERRDEANTWPDAPGPRLELMRAVKARFDPAGVCNPGVFVGGL